MSTEFIRRNSAAGMMPWLFRSYKNGDVRPGLSIIHGTSSGVRVEFSGPELLGADDLRVLQGLVSLATKPCELLRAELADAAMNEPTERAMRRMKLALGDDFVIKGSYAALAREIGHADLSDTRTLRACIERMCKVSAITEEGPEEARRQNASRLITDLGNAGNGTNGRLHVDVNPQITGIVLGLNTMRIDMDEVRALRSDPARLIYQRLCGWICPGKSGRISIGTLCSYVWLEDETCAAIRQRRVRARRALQEIIGLGWQVEEYEPGEYKITRPAANRQISRRKNCGLTSS
ncbi:MAG: hypothetical protein A2514_07925 [Gammaproteobacteria bacterium RIFOXYD12_FULL_61_37]|nr:MAG: hypothetical protein A2514_07925 [Gammaproteobacteria bacterium RIFOXYD12_FULL_61_37]